MSGLEARTSKFNNGALQLAIDTKTLAGRLVARDSGEGWSFEILKHLRAAQTHEMEPGVQVIWVSNTAQGAGGVEAEVRLGENIYHLGIQLEPHAPEAVFTLEPVHEPARIDALSFPGPFLPTRGWVTQLVLPSMLTNGTVYRPAIEDHWVHRLNVAGHSGLNMPFWGLQADTNDVLIIIETADDVALTLEKSIRRPLEVASLWTASLGSIRYPRRLRVSLLEEGGYVRMAKVYRAHVQARGRFKSLAQKIEERPLARHVAGGPYFSLGYLPFSERKFRQVVSGLREIGYTNGIIGPIDHIQWDSGAWLNDYQPFIKAPHYGPIAADAGFAAFSWLYLEDMLTWDKYFDPEWLVRTEHGRTTEGWFNRDYEYQLLCSKVLKQKHSLLKDEMTRFDALHFDTTTAKALTECWHPEHPMSKSDDRESRRARLAEVASWGRLIGSEAGYDWAFDLYDYCSSNPRRAMETGLPIAAHHVPLLGLVYHDSVVSYCWEYDPYNRSYFGVDWSEDKLLYDISAGNPPTVSPVFGFFPVIRRPAPPVEAHWVTWEDPATQKTLRDALPAAQLHGRTAHHEMLAHTFLDQDRLVSRTVYADGTEVLVNFGRGACDVEGGIVLQARSYRIA